MGYNTVMTNIRGFPIAVIALMTAGIAAGLFGGLSMALAPQKTFGLVSGLVCPEGTRLEYFQVKRGYHQPGESEPHVTCVGEDGARKDVTLKAIGTVLGGIFILVFMLVFIPGRLWRA